MAYVIPKDNPTAVGPRDYDHSNVTNIQFIPRGPPTNSGDTWRQVILNRGHQVTGWHPGGAPAVGQPPYTPTAVQRYAQMQANNNPANNQNSPTGGNYNVGVTPNTPQINTSRAAASERMTNLTPAATERMRRLRAAQNRPAPTVSRSDLAYSDGAARRPGGGQLVWNSAYNPVMLDQDELVDNQSDIQFVPDAQPLLYANNPVHSRDQQLRRFADGPYADLSQNERYTYDTITTLAGGGPDVRQIRRINAPPLPVEYPSVNLVSRTLYGPTANDAEAYPTWRHAYTSPNYYQQWDYQQRLYAQRVALLQLRARVEAHQAGCARNRLAGRTDVD